jgi:hypothetical protein
MTYVFDIDGTICTNTFGSYEEAEPYKKRIEKVNQLYDEGNIIFFATARGMGRSNNNISFAYKELYSFTKKQLESWGIKFHRLFMGKPNGDIFVDDKGSKDVDFFSE